MTYNEIIEWLEWMSKDGCQQADDILALINRQKETIEQLQTALFKCGEEAAEMQETKGKVNVKFKTGDSAKIVDNNSGHQFKIGTVVMLEKHKGDYKAYANGNYWWVTDDDLAEIDNDDLVKEFTEGGDGNQSMQEKLS